MSPKSPFEIHDEGNGVFRVYVYHVGLHPTGTREDADRLLRSVEYERKQWNAKLNEELDDLRGLLRRAVELFGNEAQPGSSSDRPGIAFAVGDEVDAVHAWSLASPGPHLVYEVREGDGFLRVTPESAPSPKAYYLNPATARKRAAPGSGEALPSLAQLRDWLRTYAEDAVTFNALEAIRLIDAAAVLDNNAPPDAALSEGDPRG